MITHELKLRSDIYICKICAGIFVTDVSDQECRNPMWYTMDKDGNHIELGRNR